MNRPYDEGVLGPAKSTIIAQADIRGRDDIAGLLTDFYGRTFDDDLLGPIFLNITRMDLDEHLLIICDFWQTVLFSTGRYRRNSLQPHLCLHARAHLVPAHFERWLTLWRATVDARHRPEGRTRKAAGGAHLRRNEPPNHRAHRSDA